MLVQVKPRVYYTVNFRNIIKDAVFLTHDCHRNQIWATILYFHKNIFVKFKCTANRGQSKWQKCISQFVFTLFYSSNSKWHEEKIAKIGFIPLKMFWHYLCLYYIHVMYSYFKMLFWHHLNFWTQDMVYFGAIQGNTARVNQHKTWNKCFNLKQEW